MAPTRSVNLLLYAAELNCVVLFLIMWNLTRDWFWLVGAGFWVACFVYDLAELRRSREAI